MERKYETLSCRMDPEWTENSPERDRVSAPIRPKATCICGVPAGLHGRQPLVRVRQSYRDRTSLRNQPVKAGNG